MKDHEASKYQKYATKLKKNHPLDSYSEEAMIST